MSRARSLKPGFFRNEELASLSPLTRIFFQGLWCEADRRGIVEDRPVRLKASILPYDKANPEKMLQELEKLGFIRRYVGVHQELSGSSSGAHQELTRNSSGSLVRCIIVLNFSRHQTPHRDEKDNGLPYPDNMPENAKNGSAKHSAETGSARGKHGADTVQGQGKTGTDRALTFNTDSLNTDSLNPEPITPLTPSSEGEPSQNKPKRRSSETTIPDDFAVTPEMRSRAKDRFGLTDEQIDAKTERFKTWAVAKGQRYARWDAGWLNFMEPKTWDQGGSPGSNGHAPRTVTADHAGEDREYLMRGLPPVWGSANGGIDTL